MPVAALLSPLADTFELLLADHDTPSLAVGVAPDDESVDLVIRPLHRHPADELIGFTAPPRWSAFGIVARGQTQAWPGAQPAAGSDVPPPGTAVRVAHLVDRSGATLTRMADAEGRRLVLGEHTMGLIPDLCRRVLGLATEDPVESPLRYWAARWLADVLDLLDPSLPGPGWATVAACHPAVAAVSELDPDLATAAADHLIVAADALAVAQPWAELHQRWSQPDSGGHGGLSPDEVGWMDPGMLARWCLGLTPDLDELFEAIVALVSDPVARQVEHALDTWGLGPSSDPAPHPLPAHDEPGHDEPGPSLDPEAYHR
jgi:hypothetical protein